MTQQELHLELAKLLEQVGVIIDEDLKGVDPDLNEGEVISYIFFIRAAEIFKAISILLSTDADQVIPAKILLRSLSEYYILLKSSIEDEKFNSRHIKHASREKEKWLEKTLRHHAVSGFKQDPKYFEEMKERTRQFHEEYESNLQPAYQLFEDRNELSMYLNVYATASMYLHGSRQSFNVYYNPGGSVKPTSDRDYSPLLRHTGLAAGQIMLQSYELFCKVLKHETTAIRRIEELLETSAGKIMKSMPSDYE
jgi:hypothetical protein